MSSSKQTEASSGNVTHVTPCPPPRKSIVITQQTISASAGAMITSIITTPLDVIKTRLQIQQNSPTTKTPYYYKNSAEALVMIARTEGAAGLWRGLAPALVMQIPSTGLYYSSYELLKEQYQRRLKIDPIYVPFFSGLSARLVAAAISTPFEYLRTVIQVQTKPTSQLLREFLSQSPKRMFTGMNITLMRDVPFSALYWFFYEYSKGRLSEKLESSHSFLIHFSSGAISGMLSATLTNPIDVIKTRIQGSFTMNQGSSVATASPSIYKTAVDIWKEEGPTGFSRGMLPRVLRVAPACAIMISSYEQFKKMFQNYNCRLDLEKT